VLSKIIPGLLFDLRSAGEAFENMKQMGLSGASPLDIEALCAAPPEAFAHSPSQMPLSCPVAPPSQRELHKDRAAAVEAWRGAAAVRHWHPRKCGRVTKRPSYLQNFTLRPAVSSKK